MDAPGIPPADSGAAKGGQQISPRVAGVPTRREAGRVARVFANVRRRVLDRVKTKLKRVDASKRNVLKAAMAHEAVKAKQKQDFFSSKRVPDQKMRTDYQACRLPTSPAFKELDDAATGDRVAGDEDNGAILFGEHSNNLDNMAVIKKHSPSPSFVANLLDKIEGAFKPLHAKDEDMWRQRERKERSPPFLLDLFFPGSQILYYTVVAFTIVFTAHLRLSLSWAFLLWAMLEGLPMISLIKKMATKRLGLPYKQEVDGAFILNPECETLAWLNDVVNVVWNNCLRGFAEHSLKPCLNELLKRKYRDWSREDSWWRNFVPQVTHLDVGDKPPWITAVKTYTSDADLFNQSQERIVLDLGFICHFHCNVQVSAAYVFRMGLREIMFTAPLRIRFMPLLRDETLFGQLQLSCLQTPAVFYQSFGLAGVMAFPYIRPVTLTTLKAAAQMCLHPQKIVFPNPMVESFREHTIYPVRPLGLLRVDVLCAKELPNFGNLDSCVFNVDPYVILKLGPKVEKSSVARKTIHPEWNELFEFPITWQDYNGSELKVYVVDFEWGFWAEDHSMGFTTVNVKSVVDLGRREQWYILGGAGDKGSIKLRTTFIPILNDLPSPILHLPVPEKARESHAILEVLVFEAQTSHLCKPMVVLQVSGRKPVTTSHGQLSCNWEFAEEFFIPVNDVAKDKITVSLMDFDAKRTVKEVTQKVCKIVKNFISESNNPQVVKDYNRSSNVLLGETILEVQYGFNGRRQVLTLQSDLGGLYKLIILGRLYFLDPEILFYSTSTNSP